ncbi:MAG: PilW family protein [Dethiobacteria bacterium]|jgi:prepilin-type N-terminal cleavage/methylation domain-containing protein|nr:prepilin-type N-terminal cleavage/methylation domain-containing protein [Bacillota bacterium]
MVFVKEDGFTLVEVLASLAIMSIFFAGVFSFYVFGMRGWQQGVSRMERQQNMRIALERITEELRWAEEIKDFSDMAAGYEYSEMFYSRLEEGINKRYRFYLRGEQLVWESYLKGKVNSYNVIALGITELRFRVNGGKVITVELTAEDNGHVIRMQSAVRPRNL